MLRHVIVPLSMVLLLPTADTVVHAEEKINFEDHIKPIFRDKCLSCHNTNKKSSDLDLSSYSSLMQGGASGASVEVGDSGASYLYSLISHQSEPYMPPNSDRLPDETLEIVRKWIEAGAPETASSKVSLKKKNNVSLAVDVSAGARPEGPAPMPDVLNLEPVVHTTATTAVAAVATNPWSKLVAVAGQKQVVLYHSETLDPLGVLPFPEGRPRVLKFSRNGALLLAGGGRGASRGLCVVWDVRTGEPVMTVGDELDEVLAADISADQSLIALGGPEKVVRVYSTATGELAYECRKHTDWVYSVEFSPDGVLLGTADRSGGLLVWEAHTGREYLTLNGHTGAVNSVSWRIDGNVLASASEDGTIRLWEMENGAQVKSWAGHGGGTFSVEFCRDGRLVSSGRDRVVKLWDQNGGALVTFEAFNDLALVVSHCDETDRVIAGDFTGEVRVWNGPDGARIGSLSTNPPMLESRLSQAIAAADPVQEKVKSATSELNTATEMMASQQKKLESSQAVHTAAVKKAADQKALITGEEQKLATEQEKELKLTAAATALAKAIPELKNAAEKSAAAAEMMQADEELKKVVEAIRNQVTAREAELKTTETSLVSVKESIKNLSENIVAQKQQLVTDEQAVATAKQAVDNETAALQTAEKVTAEKSQALAAAQQELAKANATVARWQHYIALRDELLVLEDAKKKRDEFQLTSLQMKEQLDEKQQMIEAMTKTMADAKAAMAAGEQKSRDLTATMGKMAEQKTSVGEMLTKTQTAVPMVAKALEQLQAALVVLPDSPEIKSSAEGLAAAVDRQQKSIVTMTQQLVDLDKQMAELKVAMDTTQKVIADSAIAAEKAQAMVTGLQTETAPIEAEFGTVSAKLQSAVEAVEAAENVVENRRQQLRPQLQLSQAGK